MLMKAKRYSFVMVWSVSINPSSDDVLDSAFRIVQRSRAEGKTNVWRQTIIDFNGCMCGTSRRSSWNDWKSHRGKALE